MRGGMLQRVQSAALIVNPFSSRVTEAKLEAVERVLAAYAEIETLPTSRRGHATGLARDAANNHDAVLVFSGDGVFNEVVNGIEKQVPLGFIPGGRTNVLPRALGLPRDPVAAAQQDRRGARRRAYADDLARPGERAAVHLRRRCRRGRGVHPPHGEPRPRPRRAPAGRRSRPPGCWCSSSRARGDTRLASRSRVSAGRPAPSS